MTQEAWLPDEEVGLAAYVADQVTGRATGRLEDECLVNQPRDRYFIGSLRPREDSEEVLAGGLPFELLNKLAPSAFGIELRLAPTSGPIELAVELDWTCYYRVFPTFEQQRRHQLQQPIHEQPIEQGSRPTDLPVEDTGESTESAGIPDGTSVDGTDDIDAISPASPDTARSQQGRRRPSDSLFVRFRKVPSHASGRIRIRVDEAGEATGDVSELKAAIDAAMEQAARAATGDAERIRTARQNAEQVRVPDNALSDERAFQAFLGSLRTEVQPSWRLTSGVRIQRGASSGGSIDVSLEWLNESPRLLGGRGRESLNTEPYLFDARAEVLVDGADCLPYELQLAPRGFRYDREIWGRGFNVAVDRIANRRFATNAAPIFRQPRYVTRAEPEASFESLASDPVPTLERVAQAMEAYIGEWRRVEKAFGARPGWNPGHAEEFERSFTQFSDELARFRRGIELLANPDVDLAFRLTNETFRRGRNRFWRIFQLVFLVGQIPGTASLVTGADGDERRIVDIIFFPTGGGKTEAYLAAVVFNCFLDRLRGKTAGVTAWIRFPLRLLTLQQTQRVTDAIAIAELVRQESADERLKQADPFAVGYFVGQDGSPNEIADPVALGRYGTRFAPTWSQARDPAARQAWKRIARCPACRTRTIVVDLDESTIRLSHRCTNADCPFPGGVLPVYVVDNEIYRYLPSVLVGTIDKLAGVGNNRKASMLFGKVEGSCSRHGYYFRRCTQSGCREAQLLQAGVPAGLSGPSVFVQDELHLLREGLGTFDGHYETFVQEMSTQFGNPPIKIIASSATIEAFARQVQHLFGRPPELARVFPGPGPTLQESFYAKTEAYPQRLFVGVLPHNKTIFNATLELLELFHRVIAELAALGTSSPNPFGGRFSPGSQGWHLLLDGYTTSLTYFLNKRELDSIRTDVEGDLNPNLRSDGFDAVEVFELTGGVGTDDIERVLARLEQPKPLGERQADAVLATSMVSHGVDVERLNMMLFYGMPRQTAEYIQASSRVGRQRCAVVFVALHPARERDQSHYQYFHKYHEFLGQLVEPVAINRWAKFAMGRTMPGLFMATLLQITATQSQGDPNQYYMLDALKRKVAAGEIVTADFVPLLEQAYYGTSTPETADLIEARVRRYLDQLLSAPSSISFASEALIPKPMASLREVDEQIEIELDLEGTTWASRS